MSSSSLRIPPNWKDVKINKNKNAKVLAIGTDEKGRKQYIYNEKHIKRAHNKKYKKLRDFLDVYPILERKIKRDLANPSFNKDKVIAILLYLEKKTFIRAGNEKYVDENNSYGISSLRKKHVQFKDGCLYLNFKAKSNKQAEYCVKDKKLIRYLKQLIKMEGKYLFQYRDENNKTYHLTTAQVNKYIKDTIGNEYSIKIFRTLAANILFVQFAVKEVCKSSSSNNEKEITAKKIELNNKKMASECVKKTAEKLKHTTGISKKSYIFPEAVEVLQKNPEFYKKVRKLSAIKILKKLIDNK